MPVYHHRFYSPRIRSAPQMNGTGSPAVLVGRAFQRLDLNDKLAVLRWTRNRVLMIDSGVVRWFVSNAEKR